MFFKDYYADFKKVDCEIIGIGSDNEKSHKSFKNNYKLPFKLLSDSNIQLRKELNYPKTFLGLSPAR